MSCCGQQRAALAESNGTGQAMPGESGRDVKIEFTQRKGVTVRGPVTGQAYRFDEGAYVQAMDRRDAEPLVLSGYFRMA